MPKPKTTEQFIEQSIKIHGNKYNYSMVRYINYAVKVCIICPVHGEFWQKPDCHLQKAGCTKCAIERRSKTQEQAIGDFIRVHGNKYNYANVNYKDDSTKICIVCLEHGEFWQEPNAHKRGAGCPGCYKHRRSKSQEDFIKEARGIHGDKYDYSEARYISNKGKVCIICPTHGEFWQEPHSHLSGRGCVECGVYGRARTTKEFIQEAIGIHGNRYDYSRVDYIKTSDKVCIICPTHGEFWQTPKNHLKGHRCPKCCKIVLKDGTICDSQTEAYMYLKHKNEGISFFHNKRYGKELGNMRYDFYFPSLGLYEEVTSYDLRSKDPAGVEAKIRDFYLRKIEKKKNFVERAGYKFNFVELRLTKEQQVYVFSNVIQSPKRDKTCV